MRRVSRSIPFLIVGVSLYFVAVFGRDAIAHLASPVWGFDDRDFARAVFDIGAAFGAGPRGLVMLAAFFAALQLAVAILFAFYVATRMAGLFGGETQHEMLDAGVVLALIATFFAAAPALLEATPQLLAQHRPVLWLAGLAATLSLIERAMESERPSRLACQEQRASAERYPGRPRRRCGAGARRWDILRRQAGSG